ncbi:hypothetical protein pb186bvf_010046 [Paramecium bursaria]
MCLITTIYTYRLSQIVKFRNLNPIQELSPFLTISQGLSLYVFIISTLGILFYYHLKGDLDNTLLILTLGTTQNFGRGSFIIITIMKALRIVIAFRFDLSHRQFLVKIFKSQILLVFISYLFTFLVWTLPYLIAQILDDERKIVNYEIINYVGAFNNLVEVCSSLFIIMLNIQEIHYFDALKEYINIPLLIYSLWIFANTFINIGIKEDDFCLPNEYIIMMISQILRSVCLFYFCIIRIIKNSTIGRMAFTPSTVLQDFESFMMIPDCAKSFYVYVVNFNQAHLSINDSDQYFNHLQSLQQWMSLKREKDMVQTVESNSIFLLQHMNRLFDSYKRTKAYCHLQKVFYRLDRANRNFYLLDIIRNYIA